MQLNKGDVIEVLNYAGFSHSLREKYGVVINIERKADSRTGRVIVDGWQQAVNSEITMKAAGGILGRFVEERVKAIAEAKLEKFEVVLN